MARGEVVQCFRHFCQPLPQILAVISNYFVFFFDRYHKRDSCFYFNVVINLVESTEINIPAQQLSASPRGVILLLQIIKLQAHSWLIFSSTIWHYLQSFLSSSLPPFVERSSFAYQSIHPSKNKATSLYIARYATLCYVIYPSHLATLFRRHLF